MSCNILQAIKTQTSAAGPAPFQWPCQHWHSIGSIQDSNAVWLWLFRIHVVSKDEYVTPLSMICTCIVVQGLLFTAESTLYISIPLVIKAMTDSISAAFVLISRKNPDSKVHEANIGPIWGRQDPGGPHIGPMNFAIWDTPAEIRSGLV